MKIGINPCVDCVFKYLFGSEENKELLLALVNAVLEEAGENKIVEVELLNPYNPKKSWKDKLSIVDIKARTQEGEWFLIEVQAEMYSYFPKRLLYYWARHYQSQLKESEVYEELKKVTLICFCVEKLPLETQEYYTIFQIMDSRHHLRFCEDLAIHTIEFPKFRLSEQEIKKPLEKWTYFLKHGENLDDEQIPKQLEGGEMAKAIKELKVFTLDDKKREEYESRIKALRDQKSSLAAEFRKGEEIGIKKGEEIGIKKGIEALLEVKFEANGLTLMEQVQKISDLDQLTKVQEEIKKAKDIEEVRRSLKS